MKKKIIHHLGKHLDHDVIETQTLWLGFVIKREFLTVIF
jgi:hypothetical protein